MRMGIEVPKIKFVHVYSMCLLLALEELQNAVVGCAFCLVANHMPRGEPKHKT